MKNKKEIILVCLLLNSIAIIAQKNQIKIGGGLGGVPYEMSIGTNIELQYEYKINTKFSGFMALGLNYDNFSAYGMSQGTDGTDTWNNSYQYEYSERFKYVDLGVKYSILRSGERYEMKASLGGSLAQSVFQYPEDIYINRGLIEQYNEVTRKVELGMLLFGIENYVFITDRFFLNLNLAFRTTFKERKILAREVKFHNNLVIETSGILNLFNINFQVGYQF